MIIEELDILPTENEISDVLIKTLSSNPKLISAFVSEFAKEHKEDSYKKISTRTQLSSILPGISTEIGKKQPDLILLGEKNLILIENKISASLNEKQLRYYTAALTYDKNREGVLLVIAPITTRYVTHGYDIKMLSWDQIYSFIETHMVVNEQKENTLTFLNRYRWEYYQKIFNDVIPKLAKIINYRVSYPGQKSIDKYYSKHIILPAYPDITFSLGIYIKAPSYLLVNPYKIIVRGKKYKMDQGAPIVKTFKELMIQKLRTGHALSSIPGYIVDLISIRDNSSDRIAADIKSILIDKSPDIQSILSKL